MWRQNRHSNGVEPARAADADHRPLTTVHAGVTLSPSPNEFAGTVYLMAGRPKRVSDQSSGEPYVGGASNCIQYTVPVFRRVS